MLEALNVAFEGMIGIGALVGAYVSLLGLWQARKNTAALVENKAAMTEQHRATNSRLSELLVKTAEAAKAEGHATGIIEERGRNNDSQHITGG